MLRDKDAGAWELKYKHGARASSEFTRKGGAGAVPAHLRGTVIHGVLERIEAEAELSRLLDETIGSLDDPDIENASWGPGQPIGRLWSGRSRRPAHYQHGAAARAVHPPPPWSTASRSPGPSYRSPDATVPSRDKGRCLTKAAAEWRCSGAWSRAPRSAWRRTRRSFSHPSPPLLSSSSLRPASDQSPAGSPGSAPSWCDPPCARSWRGVPAASRPGRRSS